MRRIASRSSDWRVGCPARASSTTGWTACSSRARFPRAVPPRSPTSPRGWHRPGARASSSAPSTRPACAACRPHRPPGRGRECAACATAGSVPGRAAHGPDRLRRVHGHRSGGPGPRVPVCAAGRGTRVPSRRHRAHVRADARRRPDVARPLCGRRLRSRPPRRAAAREPPRVLLPLSGAQRARLLDRPDQSRLPARRDALPDGALGSRPRGRHGRARGRAGSGRTRASHAPAGHRCRAHAEDAPKPPPAPRRGAPGLDSETSLLYTSGTTGRPKGCILTNFYYLNAGAWYRDFGGRLAIEPGRERFLNPLPLFHMNAQAVTATCAILTANCLAQPERFSPSRWWKDVVAAKATIIHYLGVMPRLLLNHPETPEERDHHVKFGFGAGVEPELHARFEERFGFPLVEVWGMTETGRCYAALHEPRQITTRAFGRPFGGLEGRVVDDADRDVPRGSAGELLVHWGGPEGPRHGFFAGYLKNAEATEEAWRGGWFHTGDVVRQMDDDMLVFVDRKKNIIRRSGENIAAAEVEACLQAHASVAQVAVIAVPDDVREEEVMACIVPMAGVAAERALAERLQDWALARLAYFKAPGWVLFVATLPTTGTQKVQKTQIFPKGEDPRRRPTALDLRERKKRA